MGAVVPKERKKEKGGSGRSYMVRRFETLHFILHFIVIILTFRPLMSTIVDVPHR
jgi:hypothetical protein